MRRLSYLLLGVPLFALLQGPVLAQPKKSEELKNPPTTEGCCAPARSLKHLDGRMLVFVVNGAGGSTVLSDHLYDVNAERHLGLCLQTVPWSRQLSTLKDLTDSEAQLNAAGKLACNITAIRKECPNAHIFLIGYSVGARVALAAAEMSPEKSIDRVIVLAPAVSSTYDLTRVLKATRYGVDNFYSSEDCILEYVVEHIGTADGQRVAPAGRVGFQLSSCDPKDVAAYRAVRQTRWNEDYCGSGGHVAWTLRHNLKKAVVPLFFSVPVSAEPALKMPPAK